MTDVTTTVVQTSALDSLVGDGKKFASVEDLAAGKLKADTHISRLEDETKVLRKELTDAVNELTQMRNKVSILDRLSGNPNPDPNKTVVQTPTVQPEPKVVGLSEEDVVKVIESRDNKKASERNKAEVDATLAKLFGNDAKGFLVQKARDLDMTPEELVGTALRSPKAFYNMIGVDPNPRTSGTTYVGNRHLPANPNEPVRNNAYYEGLKSKMGVRAFIADKSLQNQRYRDMEALGDAW